MLRFAPTILVAAFVAGLAGHLMLFGPVAQELRSEMSKVTVSRETTFFTGPLREDGYVDFAAAINARLREGVTTENNACIPLYRAIGTYSAEIDLHNWVWGKAQINSFFQQLGVSLDSYIQPSVLDELRPTGSPYKHFRDYELPDSRFDGLFRFLHDAAGREKFFAPLVTNSGPDSDLQPLFGSRYPSDKNIREAGRVFFENKETRCPSSAERRWWEHGLHRNQAVSLGIFS